VSNIPITLPTVRAERFWYFPAIGTSVLLALAFAKAIHWPEEVGRPDLVAAPWLLFGAFMICQAVFARRHANDYTDDLVFWDATRHAVPRSAKAHLNYSVMQGARGNLEARLEANRTALDLAPTWPMANVYLGDTLCRLHRPTEAWPHYARGFELAPNERALVALAVQCLWDEHALDDESPIRDELEDIGEKHPGSWLEYIARDTLSHGEDHGGVDPQYRPRGYNEGPKSE
jgi:protein O-mannosyl-transferase